jgi:peptide/nickel transport system permease protein
MLRYVFKRLLMLIPVLLGATFFVFFIMELSPEDPAITILGADATPEAIAELHTEMGLDQPLLVRYGRFINNMLHGDLGTSYKNRMDVMDQILDKLPNTLLLAVAGIFIAVAVGVPVGILSAKKQYSIFDTVAMIFTLILAASPAFWFGLVMVILFSETGVVSFLRHGNGNFRRVKKPRIACHHALRHDCCAGGQNHQIRHA